MIEIMITNGKDMQRMEFSTMSEALNHISTTDSGDAEIWIRLNSEKQRCPVCGAMGMMYNYLLDSMCCNYCGHIRNERR